MPVFTDQTGFSFQTDKKPTRIVSLVPSQTELLFDLGLEEEVVGITKFCIHPTQWWKTKTRVGGTKQLHLDTIEKLNPDLVIANKEENLKEQVIYLQTRFPVWTSDISNPESAFEMIKSVGALVGKRSQSDSLVEEIKTAFEQLVTLIPKFKTAYLIWQKPYMTVGRDTFINAMMETAGFDNIYSDELRYPEITIDDLVKRGCELLLLSSEPFPFKKQHAEDLRTLLPGLKIILVDGEMFSWYGSRMRKFPAYLAELQKQLGIIT